MCISPPRKYAKQIATLKRDYKLRDRDRKRETLYSVKRKGTTTEAERFMRILKSKLQKKETFVSVQVLLYEKSIWKGFVIFYLGIIIYYFIRIWSTFAVVFVDFSPPLPFAGICRL